MRISERITRLYIMVPLGENGADGEREVQAWPTISPHFVVSQALGGRKEYVVTHVRSGLRMCSCDTRDAGRKIAGALAAIPLPWGKITGEAGTTKRYKHIYLPFLPWINALRAGD